MGKMLLIFRDDLRRIGSNTITLLVVIGLVLIPSLFSWYNLLACWDVFENTGHLKVAVANEDEGYQSDLVPLKVQMGDQVVSALRANDQMEWIFCDSEEAIDGARSGRYYAAVVIPATFSRDMMSVFSASAEQAPLVYYTNEKVNAIAPKMTDIGADSISNQVNTVFEQTLSEIALNVASSLMEYSDRADADGRLGTLARHISEAGAGLRQGAAIMEAYRGVLQAAEALVADGSALLDQVQQQATAAGESYQQACKAADDALAACDSAGRNLQEALDSVDAGAQESREALDAVYDDGHEVVHSAMGVLDSMAKVLDNLGLTEAAQQIRTARSEIEEADRAAANERTAALGDFDEAAGHLSDAETNYTSEVEPQLKTLTSAMGSARDAVERTAQTLGQAASGLDGSGDSLRSKLQSGSDALGGAAGKLEESGTHLEDLGNSLVEALASGDSAQLRSIIGPDARQFAQSVAAPIALERIAVYPVSNFGSAMAPLYTTLALWIGALLIMVAMKTQPSPEALRRLGDPTLRQVFFGRFLTVAVISLLQSTVLALGNLLFIGVQAQHPWLYLVCFWVAGLVFAFIMYTLVALFANLGKALGVILLVVQISGGGGSYPLALLPQPIQEISPFLPITHAVEAMRAAMFGVYANDFWTSIGALLLFVLPLLVLIIALIGPLKKFVPRFVERIEASKVM